MSYQSIVIVGNLGRDPEIRYTPSGQIVCHLSVATTRMHKEEGEVKKETSWFRVSTWGRTAESCNEYLKQGAKVLVEGHLNVDPKTGGPRIYTRQDGSAGASFEINANTVKFLSRSQEASEESPTEEESLLAIPF
jgi:single-strand DNA-binding protein